MDKLRNGLRKVLARSRALRFRWVAEGDVWHLRPSPISVRPEGDFWTIYVHDRPVNARYTGMEPAKREAWLYAQQHRVAYFGTRRIELVEG